MIVDLLTQYGNGARLRAKFQDHFLSVFAAVTNADVQMHIYNM